MTKREAPATRLGRGFFAPLGSAVTEKFRFRLYSVSPISNHASTRNKNATAIGWMKAGLIFWRRRQRKTLIRVHIFARPVSMKILFPLTRLSLFLFAASVLTAASDYHVEVKCEQKRFDVKRSASQSTESAEESWGYVVTITNHSFKDIPDLRVEYVVFSQHQRFGSTAEPKPERNTGSKTLGNLPNSGKTSFETEQVTLKKARLKADWYYGNGAKGKAKDELSGIWLRIYSGSDLIDEFAQPAALKTREKWEG